jgi:hypothetical protein
MTTHEGLAGGLIGAGGALFAAWLAIDAIQQQIPREVERQKVEQAEVKISAVACVTSLVRAAAGCRARNVPRERRNEQVRHAGKSSRLRSGRSARLSHDDRRTKCLREHQRTTVAHTNQGATLWRERGASGLPLRRR